MFEDLHEQEHVFGLLDDLAVLPTDYDLTWKTGNKSPFDKKITELMLSVQELEQKTINKNPNRNLRLGFSYQSELLARLWFSLNNANTSAKLLANLPDIKILLFKSMIIGIDIKSGKLELLVATGQTLIDGCKKNHEALYGTKVEKENERTMWQSWVDAEIKNHPNHSFENIKALVVKNHPQDVSIHQLKRYTKDSR